MNDIVLKRNHQLERENNLDFSNSALEIECLECKQNSYDVRIIEQTTRLDSRCWHANIIEQANKEIYNIFTHLKNYS